MWREMEREIAYVYVTVYDLSSKKCTRPVACREVPGAWVREFGEYLEAPFGVQGLSLLLKEV